MQTTAPHIFHANGKLLLTGEYFVLDGALALAMPVRLGQSLQCQPVENQDVLTWQSVDEKGVRWFEAVFRAEDFACLQSTDKAVSERLQKILREATKLNPNFPASIPRFRDKFINHQSSIITQLEFPRTWGLGSSSTLIYCIARWAQVDAFELQFRSFGGSGYDIACASASSPILYQLQDKQPHVQPCNFQPTFANCLYFIYLGKKQDSREGIARYQKVVGRSCPENSGGQAAVDEISALTKEFLTAATLSDFEKLMRAHERLIGQTVRLPRAKDLYFSDFWGEIKSLGAWGGDFVLATSDRPVAATQAYFHQKGFDVVLTYFDLALPSRVPGARPAAGNPSENFS